MSHSDFQRSDFTFPPVFWNQNFKVVSSGHLNSTHSDSWVPQKHMRGHTIFSWFSFVYCWEHIRIAWGQIYFHCILLGLRPDRNSVLVDKWSKSFVCVLKILKGVLFKFPDDIASKFWFQNTIGPLEQTLAGNRYGTFLVHPEDSIFLHQMKFSK